MVTWGRPECRNFIEVILRDHERVGKTYIRGKTPDLDISAIDG